MVCSKKFRNRHTDLIHASTSNNLPAWLYRHGLTSFYRRLNNVILEQKNELNPNTQCFCKTVEIMPSELSTYSRHH